MSFIEIRNINKFYGRVQALSEVSLRIPKGGFVTLLGPSGSGKTTLLKILAGFEGVSSGQVLLDGHDITAARPEKRNFGLVFQGYALFPHMSVFDNIAYPLRVRRKGRAEISRRVQAMLELVQLESFARRRPHELSGGQQQRVALARALVFEPDLLLLDEPMSALDKKLRGDLQDQLRDIHRRLGTTFINVTHDQEEAMHMSDSIAVMNHGRIEQFDSAHRLYRRPTTRFVADFIGKSNIFAGRIETGAAPAFVTPEFRLPLPDSGGALTEATEIMLRPEDLHIIPAPSPTGDDTGSSNDNGRVVLDGQVAIATYSGDRALYTIGLPSGRQVITYGDARDGALQPGAPVRLAFNATDCIPLN